MAGHFPELTIYPGVFILESVSQAAAVALGEPVCILRVFSMRFTAPLFAKDVLIIDSSIEAPRVAGHWHVNARCWRADGTDVAAVRLEVQAEVIAGA